MGQYYAIAFKRDTDETPRVNIREVEGCGYIMAKLMEHSYFGNPIIDAVAAVLEGNKRTRLAWVGDYAEDDLLAVTNGAVDVADVWGDERESLSVALPRVKFDYKGKFLVNHTKKVYVSFDEYLKTQKSELKVSPISLLTAVGNGRGGGDYSGQCESKVGTWAWDELSIESDEPEGYEKETDISFVEEW